MSPTGLALFFSQQKQTFLCNKFKEAISTDTIQRTSAFYAKKVLDINSNPKKAKDVEKTSSMTLRDVREVLFHLPDKALDTTIAEFEEISLKPKKERDAFIVELFADMDEDDEKAIDAILGFDS